MTDLVSELVQAAKEVEKLDAHEMARLLDEAMTTISDTCVPRKRKKSLSDAVMYLQAVQGRVMRGEDVRDQVKAALLDAARVIRDLHIVLDTGD